MVGASLWAPAEPTHRVSLCSTRYRSEGWNHQAVAIPARRIPTGTCSNDATPLLSPCAGRSTATFSTRAAEALHDRPPGAVVERQAVEEHDPRSRPLQLVREPCRLICLCAHRNPRRSATPYRNDVALCCQAWEGVESTTRTPRRPCSTPP